MKPSLYCLLAATLLFSCGQKNTPGTGETAHSMPPPKFTPANTSYRVLASKDSIKNFRKYFGGPQSDILCAINRTDAEHLATMDSILLPADISGNIIQYSPFPQQVPYLQKVSKIIFFSYPAQYFGAYENGQLVYSGPTNMGREKDKTPTGLFYTNWKAEETKSTFNDEWELKWNFNIENKEGVGWHQYAMPGYPASHSCLRLQEGDAKYLYSWADEWKIKGTDDIIAYGTPVIVFGDYPFGSSKPWMQMIRDAHSMDINAETLEAETSSHMADIIAKQQERDSVRNNNK